MEWVEWVSAQIDDDRQCLLVEATIRSIQIVYDGGLCRCCKYYILVYVYTIEINGLGHVSVYPLHLLLSSLILSFHNYFDGCLTYFLFLESTVVCSKNEVGR